MKALTLALTFTIAVTASAVAADCDSVVARRYWQNEGTFYAHGETVLLPVGETADLYVQVESRSDQPYLTKARLAKGSSDAAEIISFRQQDADDVDKGRIQMTARSAGLASVAYGIEGRSDGGVLALAPACAQGFIPVRVVDTSRGRMKGDLTGSGTLTRQVDRTLTNAKYDLRPDGRATLEFGGTSGPHTFTGWWSGQRDRTIQVGLTQTSGDRRRQVEGKLRLDAEGNIVWIALEAPDYALDFRPGNAAPTPANPAAPTAPPVTADGNRVRCEGTGPLFHRCRVSTEGGVELLSNTGSTPCVQGQNWDWDENGIWVGNGCGGIFEIGGKAAKTRRRP